MSNASCAASLYLISFAHILVMGPSMGVALKFNSSVTFFLLKIFSIFPHLELGLPFVSVFVAG
jgi:hypothetical protein